METRLEEWRARVRAAAYRSMLAAAAHSPLKAQLLYRYEYLFTPRQLTFLCECLERTADHPGPVVEIGCAGGRTTVFLNKFLDDIGSSRRYLCIDTFEGFTTEDIEVERQQGRQSSQVEHSFREHTEKAFRRTLQNSGVTRPEVFAADVNHFDFDLVGKPSLCLVDVDLYRPILHCLEELYPRLDAGGIVVVDDCAVTGDFAGALEAYREFTERNGLPLDVRHRKLGVIGWDRTTSS